MDVPEVDVIVKFGGACLTKKKEFKTINQTALTLALRALEGVRNVIVVHGAGSFGHFEAVRYRLRDGISGDRSVVGFSKTRTSVLALHSMVLESLVENGVNAFGVSPSGSWEMEEDDVVKSDMSVIEDLLRRGFVPVLHGDCVRDRNKGFNILSGDVIVEALARHFKPKRVVFVSDVDGIYDKPPHGQVDAKLLGEIPLKADWVPNSVEFSHPHFDVTGGMASKMARACNIAKSNIPVFVVGSSEEEIKLACKEGRTNNRGTKIFSIDSN